MGYTVEQIIEQVNKRTDNKAARRFDLRIELFAAIDEFCIEKHFWWRRKYSGFSTGIGTQSYDLTNAQVANPVANDLQEIDDIVAVTPVVPSGGIPYNKTHHLKPILTTEGIVAAMNPSGNVCPGDYMIAPGTLRTIQLAAPADQVALFGVVYWAIPAVSDPAEEDSIPLIPDWLHWGLFYALERRVYEGLYGQEDERFVMANGRYEEFVEKAGKRPSWATNEVIEARSASRAIHATSAARSIRSCR